MALALAVAILVVSVPRLMGAPVATVVRTNYQGWPDSVVLRNSEVEAIIVPAIGRVMQFRYIGEPGVFWENPALFGRVVSADTNEWRTVDWVNFGGDKAWPAPEGNWTAWTRRPTWRPPPAFDGSACEARVSGSAVILVSPEDPFLGIRVTRRIELPGRTTMRITTEFEKRTGHSLKVGVWVVTQLNDPVALFAPVPAKSIFTRGYILLSQRTPPGLKVDAGFVSLARDPKGSYKIGLDAGSLLWVGEKHCLRIESPRQPGQTYPDRGSNTEIYTNPDPLAYIELESLGPIRDLKAGERQAESVTYELFRRSQPTPEKEAALLRK